MGVEVERKEIIWEKGNRFDTDFMKAMNGTAVSKGGGEAIQGISPEQ